MYMYVMCVCARACVLMCTCVFSYMRSHLTQEISLTHSSTLFFEAGPLSQSQIFLISCTLTRVIWGFPHLYPLRLEFQMGSHASWAFGWVLSI